MSAAAEIQPMFFDDEGGPDLNIQFDPTEFAPVTPYSDDINDEYEQAQEQLRQLRQQEEQIKRQAAELEELSQKEEEFTEGREKVSERLNRYISILERESTAAQQLADECAEAHDRFEQHLANINSLHPESWSRADRKAELARALSYIDAAEDEIANNQPLISGFTGKKGIFGSFGGSSSRTASSSGSTEKSFSYWLKSGFAFSIPILAFAIIVLIAMILL